MSSAELPPPEEEGEPTREEELPQESPFALLLADAANLARLSAAKKALDREEAEARENLLNAWEQLSRDLAGRGSPPLHGILLKDGSAVRRVWTTAQSKVVPTELRERIPDADHYILETVDAAGLRRDYPKVWAELAKVRSRRTIQVRLKEASESPTC